MRHMFLKFVQCVSIGFLFYFKGKISEFTSMLGFINMIQFSNLTVALILERSPAPSEDWPQ